jgi:glycosyltransferase involved in cell wall biosynthesis
MPSVDVVIPNYNYARLLQECVSSVLTQGVSDLRIIIIDNASQDDSVEVARRLAAEDSRIELVCHTKNIGSHGSFNEGIDLASSDYFLILCADDSLVPGSLQLGMTALESVPEAVCAIGAYIPSGASGKGRQQFGSKAWKVTPGEMLIERSCRSCGRGVAAHSILVRTSFQKSVGHYRPALPFMDDLELLLRLARSGPIIELSMPLAIQRFHKGNMSEDLWGDRMRDLQEREAVFRSFFEREGASIHNADSLHGIARRRLAMLALRSAAGRLHLGHFFKARELLRYGVGIWKEPNGSYRTSVRSLVQEALGRRRL